MLNLSCVTCNNTNSCQEKNKKGQKIDNQSIVVCSCCLNELLEMKMTKKEEWKELNDSEN